MESRNRGVLKESTGKEGVLSGQDLNMFIAEKASSRRRNGRFGRKGRVADARKSCIRQDGKDLVHT